MKLSTSTEWLFFHLWKKNPDTGTSCPGVFLVDTVIYRWAQPYFWYFTNRDGEIIRKTKERIDIEHVRETFMHNVFKSSVVAQYLVSYDSAHSGTSQKNSHGMGAAETGALGSSGQGGGSEQEVIQFEYFEEDPFKAFLNQREKNLNAILQKFIQPKSGKNSLIKVTWSPQFCLQQRKTNVNPLDSTKVPVHEKLCTFEGPEYLSIQDSITSPILAADLEQMCVNIVKHIQDISGGNIQISRMILYFKLDDRNRLWLLFCTGLKIRERFQDLSQKRSGNASSSATNSNPNGNSLGVNNQANQGTGFGTVPRTLSPILRMSKTSQSVKHSSAALDINFGQVKSLQNNFPKNCSNCEAQTSDLYDLKLSNIIESFELGTVDNSKTILPEEIIKLIEQNKAKKLRRLNSSKKRRGPGRADPNQRILSKEEELKELIKYLDEEHQNNEIDLKLMPALIVKVWGNLTPENYAKIKGNRSWLDLTTKVCDSCFLDYTKSSLETDFIRQTRVNSDRLRYDVSNKEKLLFADYATTNQSGAATRTHRNFSQAALPSQGKRVPANPMNSTKQSLNDGESNFADKPKTTSIGSSGGSNNQQKQAQEQVNFQTGKKSNFFSSDPVADQSMKNENNRISAPHSPINIASSSLVEENELEAEEDHQNIISDLPDEVVPEKNIAQFAKTTMSMKNMNNKSSKRLIKPSFYQDPQKVYSKKNANAFIKLPSLQNKRGGSGTMSNDSSSCFSGSTSSKLSHDFLLNTISSLKNSMKDIEEFHPEDYK